MFHGFTGTAWLPCKSRPESVCAVEPRSSILWCYQRQSGMCDGRRDPESLERLRPTFANEGIPLDFLSHYKP